MLAMVVGGPKGGAVLGIPGITLLRSGDRFAEVADLYEPGKPQVLAESLVSALGLPVGAVAAVGWNDLRGALTAEGVEPLAPEGLDPGGGDAGQVAEALAAALGKSGDVGGDGQTWLQAPLSGEADGFRARVTAALAAVGEGRWGGQMLPGALIDTDGLTYLEPNVQAARTLLAVTGA